MSNEPHTRPVKSEELKPLTEEELNSFVDTARGTSRCSYCCGQFLATIDALKDKLDASPTKTDWCPACKRGWEWVDSKELDEAKAERDHWKSEHAGLECLLHEEERGAMQANLDLKRGREIEKDAIKLRAERDKLALQKAEALSALCCLRSALLGFTGIPAGAADGDIFDWLRILKSEHALARRQEARLEAIVTELDRLYEAGDTLQLRSLLANLRREIG